MHKRIEVSKLRENYILGYLTSVGKKITLKVEKIDDINDTVRLHYAGSKLNDGKLAGTISKYSAELHKVNSILESDQTYG